MFEWFKKNGLRYFVCRRNNSVTSEILIIDSLKMQCIIMLYDNEIVRFAKYLVLQILQLIHSILSIYSEMFLFLELPIVVLFFYRHK